MLNRGSDEKTGQKETLSQSQFEVMSTYRKLWAFYSAMLHNYILSHTCNFPDRVAAYEAVDGSIKSIADITTVAMASVDPSNRPYANDVLTDALRLNLQLLAGIIDTDVQTAVIKDKLNVVIRDAKDKYGESNLRAQYIENIRSILASASSKKKQKSKHTVEFSECIGRLQLQQTEVLTELFARVQALNIANKTSANMVGGKRRPPAEWFQEDIERVDSTYDLSRSAAMCIMKFAFEYAPGFPSAVAVPRNPRSTDDMLAFRDLWIRHSTWTRFWIVSRVRNLPKEDQDSIAARLMQNQTEIGEFVGDILDSTASATVANVVTTKLQEHIKIATQLVELVVSKANKVPKIDEVVFASTTMKDWYSNAVSIAQAFSTLNPNYFPNEKVALPSYEMVQSTIVQQQSKTTFLSHLFSHLGLTYMKVVYLLTNQQQMDRKNFAVILEQAVEMSDHMYHGLYAVSHSTPSPLPLSSPSPTTTTVTTIKKIAN